MTAALRPQAQNPLRGGVALPERATARLDWGAMVSDRPNAGKLPEGSGVPEPPEPRGAADRRPAGRIDRLRQSKFVAKVARYAIGSVIALITSVVVFAFLYWVGVHNTTIDSVAAFLAGAIPNWILNRKWAWEMTDRVDVIREVVGYTIVSVIALVASSAGTGWMQGLVTQRGGLLYVAPGTGLRVILVTLAYVIVQALLFVVKFVVYDRWVFTGRSRFRAALRSRRQVWTAARANRTP